MANKPKSGPATVKAKGQGQRFGLPKSAGATMKRPSAAAPTLGKKKGY